MLLTAILTLLITGGALALLARAALMPRMHAADRLKEIGAYGFTGEATAATAAAGGGQDSPAAFQGTAARLGRAAARSLGGVTTDEIAPILVRAGMYNASPEAFLGYRVLAAIGAPALWLWWATTTGSQPALAIAGLGLMALGGWTLPLTLLRKRAERRLAEIEYDLPDLIDLLVVTVEAGLGFSGSVQIAANRMEGALGEELRLMLQEQRMGLSVNEALAKLLDRCETPSMRSFVRSVIQGEGLGISIGEIMRNLADEMRKRRRAAAEERAQRAPIKLLFPLIFLIFPVIFVVLLFPALHTFTNSFA